MAKKKPGVEPVNVTGNLKFDAGALLGPSATKPKPVTSTFAIGPFLPDTHIGRIYTTPYQSEPFSWSFIGPKENNMPTNCRCALCPDEPKPDTSNAVKPGFRVYYTTRDNEGDRYGINCLAETFPTEDAAAQAARDKLASLRFASGADAPAAYVLEVKARITLEPLPYIAETTWGEPGPIAADAAGGGPGKTAKSS